jgi:hypothetical protein
MNKVLINFAHPAIARSKINAALRTAVEGLEGVTFNDLYQEKEFIDKLRVRNGNLEISSSMLATASSDL